MARVTVRDQMMAAVKNAAGRSVQLMKDVDAHGERRALEEAAQMISPNEQIKRADQKPYLRTMEEEKESIFFSEAIRRSWPKLHRAGFGVEQVLQLEKIFLERGHPIDMLAVSLDHAEWELKNGKMLDKAGAPVTDPCAWVFQALARSNYYLRPAGYVSPAEQALDDEVEELKELIWMQQKVRQKRLSLKRKALARKL